MKTALLALCAALVCTLPLRAQEQQETATSLLSDVEHGGFGGPAIKITSINGTVNVMTGAWGAWLIDHRLALGGGWFNLASPHRLGDSLELDMEYSAFTAEYIFSPERLVHYSLQLTIGGGTVDLSRPQVGNYANSRIVDDVFFVIEPGANVELNVLEFMRLHLGASYRIVSGMGNNSVGLDNADIGGPAMNLTMKFGKF